MPDATAPQTDASTAAPAAKHIHDLSFAERGKLFFRKYQYINGHHMDDVAAEQQARADFGVAPMTDAEVEKAQGPGIVTKVVDNKIMQQVGASAFIHKTWDTYVEGKKPVDSTQNTAESTQAADMPQSPESETATRSSEPEVHVSKDASEPDLGMPRGSGATVSTDEQK